jgi:hypothetical protein
LIFYTRLGGGSRRPFSPPVDVRIGKGGKPGRETKEGKQRQGKWKQGWKPESREGNQKAGRETRK